MPVAGEGDDLFPGFEALWIEAAWGKAFARVGGPADAPPLLLLHGFPQSHALWHRVAPDLARDHRVICLDLPGYGWSAVPPGDAGDDAYAKRRIGGEIVALMERIGHVRFALAGHDRGARVAYRLALDQPARVSKSRPARYRPDGRAVGADRGRAGHEPGTGVSSLSRRRDPRR